MDRKLVTLRIVSSRPEMNDMCRLRALVRSCLDRVSLSSNEQNDPFDADSLTLRSCERARESPNYHRVNHSIRLSSCDRFYHITQLVREAEVPMKRANHARSNAR